MERTQKKNTIGFEFGRDGVMPTLKEAISFLVNDLKIKDTEVHSVYLDLTDKTFFVKFIDETTLKEVTLRLKETEPFKYANGKVVQVRVAAADGFFRYVRLFNLPPEVTDSDITKVMAKYGTVRQMIREKLPLELGFDAFSGTRGVHMEVKTEIPPSLFIGHYKCRIFYDGLRNRCFVCRQEGHVKAACPSKASASRATELTIKFLSQHVQSLTLECERKSPEQQQQPTNQPAPAVAQSTTETKGVYDDATCISQTNPRNRFKTPPLRKEGVRRRQAPVTRPPATDDNGDDG
ncbi:hypothetical protein pipiens_006371 [Culex pipiens pipiens]|uniref:CCHC-type domain-containing protein n=1 Tax=Culex pipiens pipiens TaxID=38569 RepID=A0ABD1DQ30_CULPP